MLITRASSALMFVRVVVLLSWALAAAAVASATIAEAMISLMRLFLPAVQAAKAVPTTCVHDGAIPALPEGCLSHAAGAHHPRSTDGYRRRNRTRATNELP